MRDFPSPLIILNLCTLIGGVVHAAVAAIVELLQQLLCCLFRYPGLEARYQFFSSSCEWLAVFHILSIAASNRLSDPEIE